MTRITAAVCREFNAPLTIEQLTLATPGKNQVQVAIRAVAICHSDVAYIGGAWGGTLPAVYGHEAAGIVEAVGPDTQGFAPGDHVAVTLIRSCGQCVHCADGIEVACETEFPADQPTLRDAAGAPVEAAMQCGAFASAVVVDASQLAQLPKEMSFDTAALLTCGVITGFGSVRNTAAVEPGKSVAVIGCGGVGLNAIQGAVHQQAGTIIAIDQVDSKLAVAREFGATHTILAQDPQFKQHIRDATAGRRADYVFVTVGAPKAIDQAFSIVASAGAIVLVGMPPNDVMTAFNPTVLSALNQRILGSKMGTSVISRDIPMLIDLYQSGDLKLDGLISNRYSFDQINSALDDARAGQSIRNVLIVDGD